MNILYLSSQCVNCKSHTFRIMNFFLFLSIERKKILLPNREGKNNEQKIVIRDQGDSDDRHVRDNFVEHRCSMLGKKGYDTEYILLNQILGVMYTNSTPSYHLTHNHYFISLP